MVAKNVDEIFFWFWMLIFFSFFFLQVLYSLVIFMVAKNVDENFLLILDVENFLALKHFI